MIDEAFMKALRAVVRDEIEAERLRVAGQQHQPRTEKFYYVREVAELLRRSEASVRWQIHNGALTAIKVGGRSVVTAEELERFSNGESR